MSLHEIADGQESNSDHDDARFGGPSTNGREAESHPSERDGHSSPSNGGPNGRSGTDTETPDTDREDRERESRGDRGDDAVSFERVPTATRSGELIDSVFVSVGDRIDSRRTTRCIGMQSRMGPRRPEGQSSQSTGAVSDIARQRSLDGDDDADGDDPTCAQPSGYLALR